MGSQDQKERVSLNGVRQEIVVLSGSSTSEFSEELIDWVESQCSDLAGRIEARWNTWKGVYVTHPDDYPEWSQEEFAKIWSTLESCPLVWGVDVSDDAGSAG